MSTNVSHEYLNAEKQFEEATSDEQRLIALNEMFRTVPKHKGTENMRAGITLKIKKLKEKIKDTERQAKKKSSQYSIKKGGEAQIVLFGTPNSGKSTLINALTNADLKVAPYAFTTTTPQQGMMSYKKALVQLVELPAIIEGYAEGKVDGRTFLSIARTADALIFVLNGQSMNEDFDLIVRELTKAQIKINKEKPKIKLIRSGYKGINVTGKKFLQVSLDELEKFFKSQGIYNASIILEEKADLSKFIEALDKSISYQKVVAIVNSKGKDIDVQKLNELKKKIPVLVFNGKNVDEIKEKMFEMLELILVFTKRPREKVAEKPLALKNGSIVDDLLKEIHKDFDTSFKHALVINKKTGKKIKVGREYEPKNMDIIEIYA